MQGNFVTESVDQVIELIQKLDLESIKLKIMDPGARVAHPRSRR